jgi:hypothetical protein
MTLPSPFGAGFPEQDYVLIEGARSPGQVRVVGANSPRPWDERKGYGMSGATLVPSGDALSTFELHFEFWDESEMPDWYSYAGKYFDKAARFTPGSLKPKALGIDHPQLKSPPFRIIQCVIEDCLDQGVDEYGLWTWVVKCKQYRKPAPALSKPDAAIPAVSAAQPTAKDAQDREIQSLQGEVTGLAGAP